MKKTVVFEVSACIDYDGSEKTLKEAIREAKTDSIRCSTGCFSGISTYYKIKWKKVRHIKRRHP